MRLAFWAAGAHCQIMVSFLSKSFFSRLLSIHLLSLYLGLALPWCRWRTLHSSLLNFMRLAWLHLSRSPWMASLPSIMSAVQLSLVLPSDFLRMLRILLSTLPMKIINTELRDTTYSWFPPEHWATCVFSHGHSTLSTDVCCYFLVCQCCHSVLETLCRIVLICKAGVLGVIMWLH